MGSQSFVISHKAGNTRPLLEAGVAGALCGLVEGTLFAVAGPRMGANPTREEQMQSVIVGLCLLVPLGMLGAGGLAVVSAARWRRRLTGSPRPPGG